MQIIYAATFSYVLTVFVAFIQRAANTGWGRAEDNPKWGHDKFEGPKKEGRYGTELDPKEHRGREDKRSIKPDGVEFEPKSRDSDPREDKRSRKKDDDDFVRKSREPHSNREDRRSRKHTEDESAPRSREDYDRKQDNRSHRNDRDRTESKARYDFDTREEKRSRR
uniref:Uncharacterized protein n=1 Tax=Cajanus cajan TaxID=3821 RepID=A0A151U0T2_CAJCA|nr:hypothetical protein KK1_005504 [Cajanus cajan]